MVMELMRYLFNFNEKIMKFINKSNLEFTDISSEKFRTYVWNNGATVTIKNPLFLNKIKVLLIVQYYYLYNKCIFIVIFSRLKLF
jgi:hypothetical protein